MKEFWNARYARDEYVYGTAPNVYFKQEIDKISSPGRILLPADGEGRNGVYAASRGWDVTAFDLSIEGRKKAMSLAKQSNVVIDYLIEDITDVVFDEDSFDLIGLIYVHLSPPLKSEIISRLIGYLKPGGRVIMEAFSKEHIQFQKLNPSAGGPRDPDRFYSMEEIRKYFVNFKFENLEQKVVDLKEGEFHNGKSSVIRFTGIKV